MPAGDQRSASGVSEMRQTEGLMRLTIRTLTGRAIPIFVEAAATIDDVKNAIFEADRIPADQQRLICAGRRLADGNTCAHYGIGDGSTLHLVLRLRGMGDARRQ